MEGIQYEFRNIESIPLYDKEKEIYELVIDGDFVVIPAILFHKLFRKGISKTILGLPQKNWPKEISDSYDGMKLGVQMWINSGYSLEKIKEMIKSYYSSLPEPIMEAINAIIEEIFEEESRNKKD